MEWRRCRREHEAAQWSALHREVFPDDELPGDHHARWLLWHGREPVALCSAVLIDDGTAAFLSRAGVLPEWRGRGLQRSAVRVRERWARKAGARQCVTYVLPTNTHSMRSLVRCGYEPYDPARAWAGRGVVYWHRAI